MYNELMKYFGLGLTAIYRIANPDPHYFEEPDPDPHYSNELDPDSTQRLHCPLSLAVSRAHSRYLHKCSSNIYSIFQIRVVRIGV
jgi:hypothetical protein